MSQSTLRRSRFRAILQGTRCINLATIYDPLSARIAESLGFEAGLMGGSLASCMVLGAPDITLLTLSELSEQVHRCTRGSGVPLLVDGDHGYGNALNVMRTVHELDDAGAAAVMLEDTLLPRAFGEQASEQLLPLAESLGKISAALAARGSSDLVVVARTGAHSITGLDDAVTRLRAYANAGVDALFVPGVRTREELDSIAAAVSVPLMIGVAAAPLRDPAYLASRGVRMWTAGHDAFNVAVQALHDALQAIRENPVAPVLPALASKALMNEVTGAQQFQEWTEQFLRERK